ncbi:hypothetical protein HOO54_08440 [Bacillus sp. WMMC1349]|nr:hypothetical protein [Bacillus sp. WMMC1349]
MLRLFIQSKPILIINQDGITSHQHIPEFRLSWEDIKELSICKISRQKFIGIHIFDEIEDESRFIKNYNRMSRKGIEMNKQMTGTVFLINFVTISYQVEEILEIIHTYSQLHFNDEKTN